MIFIVIIIIVTLNDYQLLSYYNKYKMYYAVPII